MVSIYKVDIHHFQVKDGALLSYLRYLRGFLNFIEKAVATSRNNKLVPATA